MIARITATPHLFVTPASAARDMPVGTIWSKRAPHALCGAGSRSHTIDGKDGEQMRRPPQRLCMSTQMAPLKLTTNTSSWAVTIADEWFDASIATIPSDEKQLQPMHVRGATMLGASISCTQGVFPAELQAIARVLAMFPLSCPLHVHSDSESSLSAIRSFLVQCNERRRLRMAGRPLLQLIHHLLARRLADTTLSHVKAHTDGVDAHSVGNRLSDYQANIARAHPERSSPPNVSQLPLAKCEHHMVVTDSAGLVIADDIRRAAMKQLKSAELEYWHGLTGRRRAARGTRQAKPWSSSAVLCCKAARPSISAYSFMSRPTRCTATGPRITRSAQLHCRGCDRPRSLGHLIDCDSASNSGLAFRWELVIAIRDCFGSAMHSRLAPSHS